MSENKSQETEIPKEDCLGCKVSGALFGVGGGLYTAASLFKEPVPTGAHRYTVIAVSMSMFGLGVYRALFS